MWFLSHLLVFYFIYFFIWFIAFYEDDHLTEEEQDVDGESVLETQPKEQEHSDDNHSETVHEGEESESIDYYQGSAREKRAMSVDPEDEFDDFPFHNVPYYFQPIYTDTDHLEDTAPKHFQNSQQQQLGGYMDDKPGLEKPNSMETQPSEQDDYHVKHMKIDRHEALESMGHYHYGSDGEARGMLDDEHSALYFRPTNTDTISREDIALEDFVRSHEEDRLKNIENLGENGDDRRFHGHMRASREVIKTLMKETATIKQQLTKETKIQADPITTQ